MMYSNEDIKEALSAGTLKIEPMAPGAIKAAGVTLHLGETLLSPQPGAVIDVKNNVGPEYKTISISEDITYELKPGEFVLGHTFEKVTVGDKLGFLIEGRSTLARVGLTIVQTAMLVYPGHRDRCVTLELANHGPNSILLYATMKIARVCLFELRTATSEMYDDKGKYREQAVVGPPIFEDEMMRKS